LFVPMKVRRKLRRKHYREKVLGETGIFCEGGREVGVNRKTLWEGGRDTVGRQRDQPLN